MPRESVQQFAIPNDPKDVKLPEVQFFFAGPVFSGLPASFFSATGGSADFAASAGKRFISSDAIFAQVLSGSALIAADQYSLALFAASGSNSRNAQLQTPAKKLDRAKRSGLSND
jgi:hypothetical protein